MIGTPRALAGLLSLVIAVAACTAAPSAQPAPSAEPTGARAFVTGPSPTPTPSPAPTPAVLWPLRGTVSADPDAVHRRPIAVRISNDATARPQAGLAAADMVWEMLAEGGITRYMAVFHSTDAAQVGPIRSARLSDLHYLPMLRGALAHVGASGPVLRRVRSAAASGAFVDLDQFSYPSAYQRVSWRAAPQNVYTATKTLRETARAVRDDGPVDVPALRFAADVPTSGAPATSATIPYLGVMRETYTYDAAASGYRRAQNGAATIDAATNQPILAANIVVISTEITEAPGIVEDSLGALSLEIRSTGTGRASVFRDGTRVDGSWSREGTEMYRFADASGAPIPLKPGQTWVHVIPADWTVESAP